MSDLDLNKIIVELVKQFSAPVVEGAKSLGTDALEKLKVNLNLCFTKYLERSHDRFSKTKTLLYREAPVSLKNFYVRTDLSHGHDQTVKESEFINVIELNRRVIVSGTAGSGKSTFCKSIFLDLIEKPRGIFPIFIELRHLNSQKDKGLVDFIVETMTNIDPRFSKNQFDYSMKLGKVMLILDGFDEINGEDRERFENETVSLASNYHNILIMVSSRPDNRFSSWEEFYHYRVLPLDKDKALSLIGKLEYDRQVKRSFLSALDESLFEKHKSFAMNPLLLTMMLLTYEQIAEIPNKIHLFYEQAFLTLFNKHDSLKSLYKRKSFSGLPLDNFKKVLSAFCILSYSDKKYYFDEGEIDSYLKKAIEICRIDACCVSFLNDLLDSVCIMQRDGLGFTFTHRSFQEYFTALFLVSMASKNKYEIFDKIAFVNDRDDVIPMINDINSDLLEQEWIIPRIERLVNDFSTIPSTNEGRLMALSMMYKGLVIHKPDEFESKEDSKKPCIAFRLRNEDGDHAHFIFYLYRIYPDEFKEFYKKRKKKPTEQQQKAESELIRLDIDGIDCLDIENLNALKNATKSRIIKSGCCEHVMIRLDFCRQKLVLLKEKHAKKQSDISGLLLG